MADVMIGAHAKRSSATALKSFTDLRDGGGSNQDNLGSCGGTGTLPLRRSYSSGAPPSSFSGTTAASDAANGISASWWSCKGTAATWLSGGYDAAYTNIINTWPANHRGIISVWHEGEDNFGTGGASDWRQIQKRAHRLTVMNRGSKDIMYATGPLIADTPDGGHGGLSLWVPVYQTSDTGAFAPPTGFDDGDLAADIWGLDWYDRYPRNSTPSGKREFFPAAGAHPRGLTGIIDDVIDIINSYPGAGGASRSTFRIGVGELNTERHENPNGNGLTQNGALTTAWFEKLIFDCRDSDLQEVLMTLFITEGSGAAQWVPHLWPEDTQAWQRANGSIFSGESVVDIGSSFTFRHSVEVVSGALPDIGSSMEFIHAIEVEAPPEPDPVVGLAANSTLLGVG